MRALWFKVSKDDVYFSEEFRLVLSLSDGGLSW